MSVVDWMNMQGLDSSFDNRASLYAQYVDADEDFRGTAEQNTTLLQILQQQQSDDGGQQPYDDGSQQPYDDGSQQPYDDGGQQPYDDGSQQPYAGGQQPYDGGQQPYDGGQQPYDGGQQPYDDGSQQPYAGGQQPYAGGQQPDDEPDDGVTIRLRHYTNRDGLVAICSSNAPCILASFKDGPRDDAFYGDGVYATQLGSPANPLTSKTWQNQKSAILNNNYGARAGDYPENADFYFEFDVPNKKVTQKCQNEGRDVFLVDNSYTAKCMALKKLNVAIGSVRTGTEYTDLSKYSQLLNDFDAAERQVLADNEAY